MNRGGATTGKPAVHVCSTATSVTAGQLQRRDHGCCSEEPGSKRYTEHTVSHTLLVENCVSSHCTFATCCRDQVQTEGHLCSPVPAPTAVTNGVCAMHGHCLPAIQPAPCPTLPFSHDLVFHCIRSIMLVSWYNCCWKQPRPPTSNWALAP